MEQTAIERRKEFYALKSNLLKLRTVCRYKVSDITSLIKSLDEDSPCEVILEKIHELVQKADGESKSLKSTIFVCRLIKQIMYYSDARYCEKT